MPSQNVRAKKRTGRKLRPVLFLHAVSGWAGRLHSETATGRCSVSGADCAEHVRRTLRRVWRYITARLTATLYVHLDTICHTGWRRAGVWAGQGDQVHQQRDTAFGTDHDKTHGTVTRTPLTPTIRGIFSRGMIGKSRYCTSATCIHQQGTAPPPTAMLVQGIRAASHARFLPRPGIRLPPRPDLGPCPAVPVVLATNWQLPPRRERLRFPRGTAQC